MILEQETQWVGAPGTVAVLSRVSRELLLASRGVRVDRGDKKLDTLSVKFPMTRTSAYSRDEMLAWCACTSSTSIPAMSQKLPTLFRLRTVLVTSGNFSSGVHCTAFTRYRA